MLMAVMMMMMMLMMQTSSATVAFSLADGDTEVVLPSGVAIDIRLLRGRDAFVKVDDHLHSEDIFV